MKNLIKNIFPIVLVSIVAFLPCVTGEFLWDDEFLIVYNPLIKSLKNIPQAFTRPFFPSVFETPQITFYRPLVTIANMVQYAIFGLRPFWWHAFNIFLHAMNAAMFYLFLVKILHTSQRESMFISMFYAILPVHTEAVCFISGRTDVLALLFILSGMLFFFQEKGNRAYMISIICFILGLLSKELVLMFPLALMAVDYARSEEPGLSLWIKHRFRPLILRLVPFFIISGIYLFIRFFLIKGIEIPSYPSGNALTSWLTMPKVFGRYLFLLIRPFDLNCDYTNFFSIEHSLLSPRVIGPGLFVILFLGLILVLFLKKKSAFLGLFWFLAFLFPVMNIFPLGLWMAERFLYIPILGFSLYLAFHYQSTFSQKREEKNLILEYSVRILAIIFFGSFAFYHSFIWQDAEHLWGDAVEKNPNNPQARIIYAQILSSRGKNPEALKHLAALDQIKDIMEKAPALSLKKEQTLVKIYTATGEFARADEAIQKAKEILPESSSNLVLEGSLRMHEGKFQEAEKSFLEALERKPDQMGAIVGLMEIWDKRNEPADKILAFAEKAISANPDYVPSYIYKGKSLRDLGRAQEAMECFQRALRLSPDSPEGYLFLADLYESRVTDSDPRHSMEKAAALYLELLRRHPNNIDALTNLGVFYVRMGNKIKAREMWEEVLKIDPQDQEALENLRRLEADVKKK